MESEKVFTAVKDSGQRQVFETGSQRDTDTGKGNPSLIPPYFLQKFFNFWQEYVVFDKHVNEETFKNVKPKIILDELVEFAGEADRDKGLNHLFFAFLYACVLINRPLNRLNPMFDEFWVSPIKRFAVHCQNGAAKYKKNNWRIGQAASRYYDSCFRHTLSIMENKDDEDHYAAVLWNIVAIVQTKKDVIDGYLPPELNDFPFDAKNFFENLKSPTPTK